MASYTLIASGDKDPGAPISTTLVNALDYNVEGAMAGLAPFKLEDAALDSTVTTAGRTWVAARSPQTIGAIGSYAFLTYVGTDTTISPGETKTGFLSYAGFTDSTLSIGSAASGTWRAMGYATGALGNDLTTLWVRIS